MVDYWRNVQAHLALPYSDFRTTKLKLFLSQAQCERIAQTLNDRPRLRHGFRTPDEEYYLKPTVALRS